jgi:SAM-dependent methyltransferase
MNVEKQNSTAADRNKGPIGDQLQRLLQPGDLVWEIGSGTGQHVVYFGSRFADIVWQPSDRSESRDGVWAWAEDHQLPNIRDVIEFDLLDEVTPVSDANVVYCCNTLHIAPFPAATESLFVHASRALQPGGHVVTYGAYRYAGVAMSEGDARFDEWLKSVDPVRGIRVFEEVDAFAQASGFTLVEDVAMPANNRLLRWRLG